MPFFDDLLDSISGAAARERAEAELRAKLGVITSQTEAERLIALEKLSPEAQRARTMRVIYIVLGTVTAMLIFSYFYFRRR